MRHKSQYVRILPEPMPRFPVERIGTKLEFSREEKSQMPQHTKVTAIAGWMAALAMLTYGSTTARADITVHVDYSQMSVSYNAGVFSVADTASSVAHA